MSERKGIHLFDLDDTLIQTQARILVLDNGGKNLRSLSTEAFTIDRLAAGERYDFAEFSDVGILSRGLPIRYTAEIIRHILKHGTQSDFGILTARGDKHLHAPFLIRFFSHAFGVVLKKGLIFTVSDARFMRFHDRYSEPDLQQGGEGLASSPRSFSEATVSEKKALVVIRHLVKRGYNPIRLYDDSPDNLHAFKALSAQFPGIDFEAHRIDPTWRGRLADFMASDKNQKALTRGEVSAKLILEHQGKAPVDQEMERLHRDGKIDLNWPGLELVFVEGKYRLRKSI